MLSNELRKYIKSLQRTKYRQKYNKFVAEGPKICLEFIRQGKHKIEYVVCTEDLFNEYKDLLSELEGKTMLCNDKELKSISSLQNPNKILIVIESKGHVLDGAELSSGWAIYLDRIQDPGNLGAIMRIADWFDVPWLLASKDSCDFYNPKVVQSAMGAHSRIQFASLSRETLCRDFSNLLHTLSLGGSALSDADRPESGILVIGNESSGVSEAILDASRKIWTIQKKGGAESLNASVACGIACFFLFS